MLNTDNKMHHFWLYVLALSEDKYYVGITAKADPFRRIYAHIYGQGSKWTRRYPVELILELQDLGVMQWEEAKDEEQRTVQDLMKVYGLQNVRGGYVNKDGRVIYMFGWFFFAPLYQLFLSLLLLILSVMLFLHQSFKS